MSVNRALCLNMIVKNETANLDRCLRAIAPQYFDVELSPVEGEDGRIVEPGHCFERAWPFERLTQWGAPDATLISDGMARFARRHGLDHARGVAINEVLTDGSIRNPAAPSGPRPNG